MQTNSRNNGNLAFGQRIMTTIKMNARDVAEWRIKLIITHLYGIMEVLSRGISFQVRTQGSHLHSPRSVDIGQWRLQWRNRYIPLLVPVPGRMQRALQQVRVPRCLDHGQWRMVQSLDGEFTNLGSWIYIDSSIREVLDQDEIVSTCFIITEIPRYLTWR